MRTWFLSFGLSRPSATRSRRGDSNPRPELYKSPALPTELLRRSRIVKPTAVVCFGHGLSEASGKLEFVEHPKDIGDKSTLAIMLALRLHGYAVLVPFGENTRYDLVIDNGNCLRRVQCKTGRLRNGAVLFATCSSYAHHGSLAEPRRDYRGQVDDFAVYCRELGAVYLIPIEDLGVRTLATLRVTPPANGQHKNVRIAAAYELARIDVY